MTVRRRFRPPMAYSYCSQKTLLQVVFGIVVSLAAGGAASALNISSGVSHNSLPPCAIWCVCKDGPSEVLQKTLDYACGHGGDCGPIRPNGACYSPDSVRAHCSYAVNSYFNKMHKSGATCDFSTTATLTSSDPSSSGCSYPAIEASPAVSTSPPKTTPATPHTTPVYGKTPPTGLSPYTTVPPPPDVLGGGGMITGMGPPGMDMYDNGKDRVIVLPRWSVTCLLVAMLTLYFWS